MGFSSSLHVCMDSSDNWLQGTIHEDSGIESSSPISGGDILTCSRPMIERRLRPPQDQALKCPRCESTHTKFCYYNNYSLSQPRYFCKTCRRYWTKGGTLRNIPVGGGCRKNKKSSASSSKKSNNINNDQTPPMNHHNHANPSAGLLSYHQNPKDLQLSNFPHDAHHQFSHLNHLLGTNTNAGGLIGNPSFNIGMLENNPNDNRPMDFMETSRLEGMMFRGSTRNFDYFGNGEMGTMNVGIGDHVSGYNNNGGLPSTNYHGGLCSFGNMSLDGNNNSGSNYNMMEYSSQRLMLPYDACDSQNDSSIDVKPNPKILSLEWQQDQGCSSDGKDPFVGYLNGPGSWTTGVTNGGYGTSTTNPLV